MSDAIIPSFKQPIRINQTVAQLNKDLISTGCEVKWSGNIAEAYQEITAQLEHIAQYLDKTNSQSFNAWLYRVDITERILKKIASQHHFYSNLAKAVLERTFIKIVFRDSFKG